MSTPEDIIGKENILLSNNDSSINKVKLNKKSKIVSLLFTSFLLFLFLFLLYISPTINSKFNKKVFLSLQKTNSISMKYLISLSNSKEKENITLFNKKFLPYITSMTLNSKSIPVSFFYNFSSSSNNLLNNVTIYFNSSLVSLSKLFSENKFLYEVDLSDLITDSITDMSELFYSCTSLKNINLKNINTSNVTFLYRIFSNCISLTSLDLSNFNTDSLYSMNEMFAGSTSLKYINFTGVSTKNVFSMDETFARCESLTSLDLSGFYTPRVKNLNDMFHGCKNLKYIDMSNFDTSRVSEYDEMFADIAESGVIKCNEYIFGEEILQTLPEGWKIIG